MPKNDNRTFNQTNQPGSVGVQGDRNNVIINPPANPYAPTITYDFNGMRRETKLNPFTINLVEDTPEAAAFHRLIELNQASDWAALAGECDKWIAATPDWLTPYLLGGIAHLNLDHKQQGVDLLNAVAQRAGGDEAYQDAPRILGELKQKGFIR